MECRHDFNAAKVLKLSPHSGDPFANFQKVSQGSIPHYYDHFGFYGCNFSKQKGPADRCLFQGRLAVARRPATINVADKHQTRIPISKRVDDLRASFT